MIFIVFSVHRAVPDQAMGARRPGARRPRGAGVQRVMASHSCVPRLQQDLRYSVWSTYHGALADTGDLGLGGVILPTSALNVFVHAAKLRGHVAAGSFVKSPRLNATALQFGTHALDRSLDLA